MCFENIPLVRDVPHGLPHRRDGEPVRHFLFNFNLNSQKRLPCRPNYDRCRIVVVLRILEQMRMQFFLKIYLFYFFGFGIYPSF